MELLTDWKEKIFLINLIVIAKNEAIPSSLSAKLFEAIIYSLSVKFSEIDYKIASFLAMTAVLLFFVLLKKFIIFR